jgi:hypothetical protein
MPITLPMPERTKRHIALRELAHAQAAAKGQTGHRDACLPLTAGRLSKVNRGGTLASHLN